MMKAKLLLIVSLFLLLSQFVAAQEQDTVQRKKTRINILHYDVATYSKSMGDVQRLIGHVKMRHDSAYFFCDSAYYYQKNNSFDAYKNVHIIVKFLLMVVFGIFIVVANKPGYPKRMWFFGKRS